jgi:adenylate kinase family enzyme
VKQPTLILIRGLPGSGKTFIASQLRQDIETSLGMGSVVTLDPDAVDTVSEKYLRAKEQFVAAGIEEKFHPYRFLRAAAERAVENKQVIIWNQPFTLRGGFERTVQHLTDFASKRDIVLPIVIVEVWIDVETAQARIVQRKTEGGHGPSGKALQQFIEDYVSFADMGYPTVAVRGDSDVTASVELIQSTLAKL